MRRATALLASLGLLISMLPATALASPSAADSWIVTVRDGSHPAAAARSLTRAHGGEVKYVYDEAINGFAFRGSAAAADAMLRNPNVTRVEADAEVWLDTTQSNATWGLDRIDQASGLNGEYTYNATGAGVTAYIIDSGILEGHVEFGGRASTGKDFVGTNGGEDCNGHGTHVAGTIGGSTYGVAKDIKLVAVRVFDCTGGSSWSTIIAAMDWVIETHTTGPAVANMSLSGGANSSVDDAVQRMVEDGVATAVAAGNGNMVGREDDACKYSPARAPNAMTISATDNTDTKASWANYGSCVDWFAPGVSITSAWYDGKTKTISGTSMATPHTAGVAALYLEDNPGASPLTVRTALFDASTKGVVRSSKTNNNHLVYNLNTGIVDETNSPATAVEDAASTSEDLAVQISVLLNDTKDEGETLTVTNLTQPDHGTAVVNADETVTYQADPNWNGTDTFTYTANDGNSDSAPATVTVTVAALNDPPDAVNDAYATPTGVTLVVEAPGVLHNDVDVDGDAVSITGFPATTEKGGTVTLDALGSFTYEPPDAAFAGVDSFSYTLSDGSLSDTASVSITVGSKFDLTVAGRSINQGSTWTAVVTITARNSTTGAAVDGVNVKGEWSGGATGPGECTTTTKTDPDTGATVSGVCDVALPGILKKTGSVTFTVTSATDTAGLLTYDAGTDDWVIVTKP